MTIAVFTPTRLPGIAVTYYSVAKQTIPVDYWLVADQLAPEREWVYRDMRIMSPKMKIETYYSEISTDKIRNLAHVDNWALKRARELEVDLLVFLQDFIWIPDNGVESFLRASKLHPFALITGRCDSSSGPERVERATADWNIFRNEREAHSKPPEPYAPEPRVVNNFPHGKLTNHAWEINWGALPYALIHSGVDFDEDYDRGVAWENTQFSFDIRRTWGSKGGYVWWDHDNCAIGMPHRKYFPAIHKDEVAQRNDALFYSKNSGLEERGVFTNA